MRVLLITSIFPPDIGGPARQVWDLAKAFKKIPELSSVVLTFGSGNRLAKEKGILIYRVSIYKSLPGFLGTLARQLNFFWQLVRIIKKEKVDIIHCHEIPVFGFLSGLTACIFGLPSIVKYPGDLVYESLNKDGLQVKKVEEVFTYNLSTRIKTLFEKIILGLHGKIWAVSKSQKHILTSCLDVCEEKIILMPNYIDIKLYKKKHDFDKKVKKILIVSRFVPWKQVEKLGEIISRLEKLSLEIEIIGEGNRNIEQKIKSLVRRKGTIKVSLLGKIDPRDIYKRFNKVDIFLSLTCYEPFAISLIEAIAVGLPVVAPAVSGIPEVIKDRKTGLLYEEGNWKMAAEKIILLVENRDLYKKISVQGQMLAKNYGINKNLDKIINFYKKARV